MEKPRGRSRNTNNAPNNACTDGSASRKALALWPSTTAGSFTCDGTAYGPLTGIWADPGESIKLDAIAGSELLKVRFPAPSSRITLTQDERSLRAPQSI